MLKYIVHLTIEGSIEVMDEVRLPLTDDLGKALKEKRLAKGITIQRLSELSAVSISHLARIERGERYPNSHILGKIERALAKD